MSAEENKAVIRRWIASRPLPSRAAASWAWWTGRILSCSTRATSVGTARRGRSSSTTTRWPVGPNWADVVGVHYQVLPLDLHLVGVANRDDLGRLRLLPGRVRQDDPADRLLIAFDHLD